MFASANDFALKSGGPLPYELKVIAQGGTLVTASAGLKLSTQSLPLEGSAVDTLIVAGGVGVDVAAANPAIVDWVQRRAKRARRVASVCTGAFLLAACGLLDGRSAATHWHHCAELARRYPHLDNDLPLPVLAEQAGMSERSFSRRYAEATGLTPARAIERLRVEAARRLLAESGLSAKRISQRCGFGSEETMRRSFLRLLAATPQEYRARFSA